MLVLEKSRSYKSFKKEMGQQNHLYITLLVSLTYLDKLKNPECPPELHTSWKPQDIKTSIMRSRQYASKSALNWCVDQLEVYMDKCNSDAMYPNEVKKMYDGTDRSVYRKFQVLYKQYGQSNVDLQVYSGIVALGIQWRNRMVHSTADNILDEDFCNILRQHVDFIKQNFCDLDVEKMLNNFENSNAPSLKEATSIIHATHKFVESIDHALLNIIDLREYAKYLLKKHMDVHKSWYAKITRQVSFRKLGMIKSLLVNSGFTENAESGLTDADLESLCNQVLQDIVKRQ